MPNLEKAWRQLGESLEFLLKKNFLINYDERSNITFGNQ